MTDHYYDSNLHSMNLHEVYETKIPRIERYLDAEIEFVRGQLSGSERVLEIAAGYGRILRALSANAASLVGVELSPDSVTYGAEYLKDAPNCSLRVADVHTMPVSETFDVVLALQNALSAVKGDAVAVVKKCVAMLGENGRAYFSSYAENFWEHRLAWFDEQAAKGLLGEVDRERSRDGVLVCKDGFTATTFRRSDFEALGDASGCDYRVTEVDGSSIFLILYKRGKSV
ncbi:class I SAM-dependent methyltransferase [Synergistaceae bacterium OttesenSCG-928-I11]|nr:class I SAM-dependent methyltransferase [Synergistaceae bacterium OttesenSCG-928-I11]